MELMNSLIFDLKQEDIDRANKERIRILEDELRLDGHLVSQYCPISCAIRRLMPGYDVVTTSSGMVILEDLEDRSKVLEMQVNEYGLRVIEAFDSRGPVNPCTIIARYSREHRLVRS